MASRGAARPVSRAAPRLAPPTGRRSPRGWLRRPSEPTPATGPRGTLDAGALEIELDAGRFSLRAALETLERSALELALARSGGNAAAAALLGEVGRGGATDPGATVRAMMRRLGIRPRGR